MTYKRMAPDGAVEERIYKIGYGNKITDTSAGFTAEPSETVTNAGERSLRYAIDKGGEAFRREVIEGAVQAQQPVIP